MTRRKYALPFPRRPAKPRPTKAKLERIMPQPPLPLLAEEADADDDAVNVVAEEVEETMGLIERPPPKVPMRAAPGTVARLLLLMVRCRRGEALFHPDDAKEPGDFAYKELPVGRKTSRR